MAEDDFERLLANVRDFDWDPSKRDQVFQRRRIAFEDARTVFQGPTTVFRSDRKGEARYVVFGLLEDVEVVFRLHVPRRHLLDHYGETSETR